jgi:competence protein ComEC
MTQNSFIWHRAPFLRLVLPLMGGIFCAAERNWPHQVSWWCLCTGLALQFAFASRIIRVAFGARWLSGLAINLSLLALGQLLYWHNLLPAKKNWVGHQLPTCNYLIGTPDGISYNAKGSIRCNFIITACITKNGTQKKATGKIILYAPADLPEQFMPGDLWLLPAAELQRLKSSGNPGSFDYATYCAKQNIYHQAFYKKQQLRKIQSGKGFNLSRLLAIAQLNAIASMRATVPEKACGLAMALLIGYRYEVDKPLLQAYSNTGVVHVIAVSGMHLGLIFLLLQHGLIFPTKKFKPLKWIKGIIVLLIIWCFSGVAGAAASIIRAAWMFSTGMLSKLIRKPMDNIQSICLCAFMLLCYNPLWLWDAGFQLSFAALLSIIIYQPIITEWMQPKNPLLNGLWQLSAVTLAAQILTLPISVSLFHQAPVYFLAANLVAVPLSSVALIMALLQWLLSAAGTAITLPAQVTGHFINGMNTAILHINKIPGAVIQQIEWTTLQTTMAYGIIICLTIWLTRKSTDAFIIGLLSAAVFMASGKYDQKVALVIFHIPHQQVTAYFHRQTMTQLTPKAINADQNISAAKRYFRCTKTANTRGGFYRLGPITIALPTNANELNVALQKTPNYCLLGAGIKNLNNILLHPSPNTIFIIDGSLPPLKATEWRKWLQENRLKYHSTWESGALQIPINKF